MFSSHSSWHHRQRCEEYEVADSLHNVFAISLYRFLYHYILLRYPYAANICPDSGQELDAFYVLFKQLNAYVPTATCFRKTMNQMHLNLLLLRIKFNILGGLHRLQHLTEIMNCSKLSCSSYNYLSAKFKENSHTFKLLIVSLKVIRWHRVL